MSNGDVRFYLLRVYTPQTGGISQFSVGLETAPDFWDAKVGLSTGKSLHELKVNRDLKELSKAIEAHYARMVEHDGYVTAERVKNAVLGIAKEPTTLLKEFEEATEEIKRSVGINHSTATYKSYVNGYMNLSRFIKEKYKKEDMPFNQLEYSFIEDYDLYLKTEQHMATGSVLQHMVFLRKMVKRAMNKGIITRNPFFGYVPDQPVSKHKWLSSEEIEKIMTVPIDKPSVDFVRDMFVFGVFTGLSYSDIKNLRKEQILTDSSGNQWISLKRQKTGSESVVPLLDIPKGRSKPCFMLNDSGKILRKTYFRIAVFYFDFFLKDSYI